MSASDWRKIEQLLREAVDGIYDERAKKLSRTIHTITAENTLLEHENNNLKEALANEKKLRQRGKALLLEPPAEYDGGAIFWSPNKVAQARLKQEQKDLKEQEVQHQKSEAIKLRKRQKLAKAQLLEERGLNKLQAKEKREAEAATKEASKQDKKLAHELKKQL
ncbi:hypothetical protein EK21DRAFT_79744 [Setomelanomma holmii]|uniref:Uncharacterized protein n=1 Tax=Setomelanomma holmii TaxID=210430 RepID=A0A9P4GYT7_9PLEO|nr:hypothetical protein EK21DRAFT_79744 [Setomelanomma holmii]